MRQDERDIEPESRDGAPLLLLEIAGKQTMLLIASSDHWRFLGAF